MQINNLINTLPNKILKRTTKFLAKQEQSESLSHIRFVQDTVTNLIPKATFARSFADLSENSFQEVGESVLVYYTPKLLGNGFFRPLYERGLDAAARQKISTPMTELNKDASISAEKLKEIKPIKAAIAASCLIIPLAEYSLCYLKNLFTLKVFHQADFNNIANLNKDKKKIEERARQEKVKRHAINNMLGAAAAFGGCLLTSLLLVKKGKSSNALQKLSDIILTPGSVFFKNNKKKAAAVNKYFSLDFRDDNGKLSLSHGQLTSCVLLGGAGYFGSSADRGKQNFLETLFRFPLVGFYVVTGSEMFERAFKKILRKKDSFKDTITNDLKVPDYKNLPELAQKLAEKNKATVETEFAKLCRQKALIAGVPFLFGMLFMGMFVAGVSRAFTQYRYNHEQKNMPTNLIARAKINAQKP